MDNERECQDSKPDTPLNRDLFPSRLRRVGREFFWIGSGQAVATLGALVGVRLLTGVLNPVVYGELALGMTVATLVAQIVFGPISGAGLRFFSSAREAGELSSFLTVLRRLLTKATVVVILFAGCLSAALFVTGKFCWFWLALAALGFALFSGYNSTIDGLQNAARQRLVVAWHQAFSSWGRFLIAVGMVMWLGATGATAMLGYVLATLLVLFSQYWFFRHTVRPAASATTAEASETRQWNTRIFSYAWPFATWGFFTWMQIASDRWALQMFATTRDVGLYAVLYQLGYYPITILSGLMVQLVAPIFFQRVGDASVTSNMRHVNTLIGRLTMVAILLTGVAVLLAFGIHGFVFKFLVAQEFRSVSWLLPGMVLAGGLFATGQIAVISLLSGTKTRRLIPPKVATAVIGVLLNMLGAAWWGIIGVVGASAITAAVYLLWILYLVDWKCKKA